MCECCWHLTVFSLGWGLLSVCVECLGASDSVQALMLLLLRFVVNSEATTCIVPLKRTSVTLSAAAAAVLWAAGKLPLAVDVWHCTAELLQRPSAWKCSNGRSIVTAQTCNTTRLAVGELSLRGHGGVVPACCALVAAGAGEFACLRLHDDR
jgi:hypothetical protein